jgi:hypothetical protein
VDALCVPNGHACTLPVPVQDVLELFERRVYRYTVAGCVLVVSQQKLKRRFFYLLLVDQEGKEYKFIKEALRYSTKHSDRSTGQRTPDRRIKIPPPPLLCT